jgi:PAS domain S-box-containing protein
VSGAASPPASVASAESGARAAISDGWRLLFWIVFSRSKNAMLVLDQDRRIVAVNDAEVELFGYSRHQMLGRRIDLLFESEEWRSLDDEWRALLRRGDFEAERTCVRADGRRVDVQYAMRWARLDGRMLALVVVLDASVEPLRMRLADGSPISVLTPREVEIVGHVAMGQRAHEIAGDLGIAESTVRSHIRNAMKKCGARSQAQLVALVCTGRMPPTSVAG